MPHMIDSTSGRANIAFLGSRDNVWHRLGTEMAEGMSMEEWRKAAGLDWTAIKVPALADCSNFENLKSWDKFRKVEGFNFLVRSDVGTPLGYVSNQYKVVQPADVLDWFAR